MVHLKSLKRTLVGFIYTFWYSLSSTKLKIFTPWKLPVQGITGYLQVFPFVRFFNHLPRHEPILEPNISLDFSQHGRDIQTICKLIGENLFRKIYFLYSEKCLSEYTAMCPSKHDAMCTSDYELEVIQNCSSHLRSNYETYPYPKGEYNGTVGPKYVSMTKYVWWHPSMIQILFATFIYYV